MGTHPIFESDFDCLTEWSCPILYGRYCSGWPGVRRKRQISMFTIRIGTTTWLKLHFLVVEILQINYHQEICMFGWGSSQLSRCAEKIRRHGQRKILVLIFCSSLLNISSTFRTRAISPIISLLVSSVRDIVI